MMFLGPMRAAMRLHKPQFRCRAAWIAVAGIFPPPHSPSRANAGSVCGLSLSSGRRSTGKRRGSLPFALPSRPTPVRESNGNLDMKLPLCLFPIFPFDHCTGSVIPWTRMPGSSNYALISCRFRRPDPRWAMAVVLFLAFAAAPLFAGGISLAQKHERRHEIDQLEDEWRNAILNSDVKAMASLLAEDYMAVTPSGTLQ